MALCLKLETNLTCTVSNVNFPLHDQMVDADGQQLSVRSFPRPADNTDQSRKRMTGEKE